MSRIELSQKIKAVFPPDPVPAEVVAHQDGALLAAQRGSREDDVLAVQAFLGHRWDSLTPAHAAQDYYRLREGFFHLTPEAFRYYLPALLTLSINGTEEELQSRYSGWAALLAQLLDPAPAKNWEGYFEERYGPLTLEQKQIVAETMRHIAATYHGLGSQGITPECEAYWAQFL